MGRRGRNGTRHIPVTSSGSGPCPRGGGSDDGLLLRGGWLRRTLLPRGGRLGVVLPLRPTARTRHPSGRDIAVLSPLHYERDIVDGLQPLDIVIRKVVEVGRSSSSLGLDPTGILFLLQVTCVCAVPPREAHDEQERSLRPARKDIGPRRRALRGVLFSAAPVRLDSLPPSNHLGTKIRNCKSITSRRLVGILEVFFNLGRPILVREICAL